MLIDEAIAQAREKAKEQLKDYNHCKYKEEYGCKGCADYYYKTCFEYARDNKQIAEWLEELKALKYGMTMKCDGLNDALEKGKKIGYKKAIDDFAEQMKELNEIGEISVYGWNYIINQIAEQLKTGGENE